MPSGLAAFQPQTLTLAPVRGSRQAHEGSLPCVCPSPNLSTEVVNQSPVYRQLALPVPVFDRIKQLQRRHIVRTGQTLTINQLVTAIVLEHQQNEECEVHEKARRQPAILKPR
jgi:hypothetical protein